MIMDYLEDSLYRIRQYAKQKNIDISGLSDEIVMEMSQQFYKNYYSYEMDEEYAALAAISEIVSDKGIEIRGFEKWIP